MATLEELVVSLVAETSGLRAELNSAVKATKDATGKMDDAIDAFSKSSSKNMGFFQTAMATMTGFLSAEAIQAVIGFAESGIHYLSEKLIEGGKAAMKEEQALVRLGDALASTGHFTEGTLDDLKKYANKMEDLTGVQDDVIISNLALLGSLTRLDKDGLKRAETGALDLSARLGIDLDTATRLMAKGVSNSTDVFKRYGLQVAEGSNQTERFNNIMRVLDAKVKGSAEAMQQTFGGALLRVKNSWDNLFEAIASSVTSNQAVIGTLNTLGDIFNGLNDELDANKKGFKVLVAEGLVGLIEGLRAVAETVHVVVQDFQFLSAGFTKNIASMGYSLTTFFGLVKTDKGEEFRKDWEEAAKKSAAAFDDGKLYQTINAALISLGNSAQTGLDKVKTGSDTAAVAHKNQKLAVTDLNEAYLKLADAFAQSLKDESQALDFRFKSENDMRQANLDNILANEKLSYEQRQALMAEDIDARNTALMAQQSKELTDLQASTVYKTAEASKQSDMMNALLAKQYTASKKMDTEKLTWEASTNKQRMENFSSTMSYISTLSQSSNKELAAIGKAAAITTATIDGYMAVQKALASAPPPFNFALAALVGVAAAANVAKIAGVGLREGGTLAGGGANMDTVPASLTKGETVVTRDLTNKLEEFLNGQGRAGDSGGRMVIELRLRDQLVDFIEAQIVERQANNTSLILSGAT